MRLLDIAIMTLIAATCLHQPVLAEPAVLKGKVLDSEGRPVGGAKIIVQNEDNMQESSGKSDGKGDFEVEHQACNTLSFVVLPSKKSGFSNAHYAHVSGEHSKHFIVRLHKGFHVSGRILAEGQGIKGLEVHVLGQDEGKGSSHTIHGGGAARTKGNGEYELLLTPGKKIIQIKNDVYSNLAPVYQHEFTITGDTKLPDMTLPLLKESK